MKSAFINKAAALLAATAICGLLPAGCDKDDFPGTGSGDGKATLILNIGLNGIPDASRAVSTSDYNGAEEGELMRTLRVIIADDNDMVEHNLFFDNLSNLSRYTTDKVAVSANNRKTLYFVANERAAKAVGINDLHAYLNTFIPGSTIHEADMKTLVLLSEGHKENWDDKTKRLLPITDIDYFDVGEASADKTYTKEFWLHRAAVKFTFLFNNHTDRDVRLDSLLLKGASDREFLFPNVRGGYTVTDKTANNYRPVDYYTPSGTNFSEVKLKLTGTVPANKTGVRLAPIYFTEGLVLTGAELPDTKAGEKDVYKMAMCVNGVRTQWRDLDWCFPETPESINKMVDIPRNTHVVVEVNINKQGYTFVVCEQPYTEAKVEPFFGLDRDNDGNIIRKYEKDGTFWSDNPRYNTDPLYGPVDTRPLLWKDVDGDEIEKRFSDGSLLATERMYRDWIHDETEKDHAYTFEKNVAGGMMVILRQKTPTKGKVIDLNHDHGMDDRPLFVKMTLAFAQRNGIDLNKTPVGTHLLVKYDGDGKPSYHRTDADGDTILQANGFQFLGSETMEKWLDTYLCKHVEKNPDGSIKKVTYIIKDRDGKVFENNNDYPLSSVLGITAKRKRKQ